MNSETLHHFFAQLGKQQQTLPNPRNALFERPLENFLPAAVLLPAVLRGQEWQILLTKRADTLRHHTGQIAFPGGRQDPEDGSPAATALRETQEEIGTPQHIWQTFDVLPPYFTPSGYAVYPVPAVCSTEPELTPNPAEVAETFYVPLSHVLNPANYRQRTFTHRNRSIQTPALPYQHYDIWGLTAGILYSVAESFRQYTRT